MRIGDLLLNSGFVSEEQLNAALAQQKSAKKTPIGQLLKLLNVLKDDELELVLQAQRKILFASMSGQLAVEALKYARLNKTSFADAVTRVLATVNTTAPVESFDATPPQATQSQSTPAPTAMPASAVSSAMKTSGISNPAGPRFAVDPKELIQKSDNLAAQKNWEQAAACLEQARTIYERSDCFEDEDVIPVYCRLAAFYMKIERKSTALESINRASELINNKGIKVSPGSISLLGAAANLCSRQGMIAEAHKLYKYVMPAWLQLLPFELNQFNLCLRDAIVCASSIDPPKKQNLRIGELLTGAGMINEDQFQEAFQKSKRTRQPLGSILAQSQKITTKDLRNAMKVQLMYRAGALPSGYAPMILKAASYATPNANEFFDKLSAALESSVPDSAALTELISKMDRLLSLEETAGLQDPQVAILAADLGDVCLKRQEPTEAEAMYRRAHAVFATAGDKYQLQLAEVCKKIARLLISQKKYPESEILLLQSMEIKNRMLGDKHPEVAEVLADVGFLYFCQANYSPAIGFLRSSWMIQGDDTSLDKKRIVLELLIKCFEQSGQDAESEIYREQLKAIRARDAS